MTAKMQYKDGSIYRIINRFPFQKECVAGCDNHLDEQYHFSFEQAQD